MGLYINFYETKKEEVGYFRKVNFILTYFDIEYEQDGIDIEIPKESLGEFVAELKCELIQYRERIKGHEDDDEFILEPINDRLRTKEVCLGGSTGYDKGYWDDVNNVYVWARDTFKNFPWDECILMMNLLVVKERDNEV